MNHKKYLTSNYERELTYGTNPTTVKVRVRPFKYKFRIRFPQLPDGAVAFDIPGHRFTIVEYDGVLPGAWIKAVEFPLVLVFIAVAVNCREATAYQTLWDNQFGKRNFVSSLEVFPGPAIEVQLDVLRHESVVLNARDPIPNFGLHATTPAQATCGQGEENDKEKGEGKQKEEKDNMRNEETSAAGLRSR